MLTDERLENILGNLLRTCVFASAAIVFAGGVCYLVQQGTQPVAYSHFHPAAYRSVSAIIGGLAQRKCLAVIQFGLLVLIATPVARVAASVVGFAVEKDRTYIAVSLLVLLILLSSLAFMR